MLSCDVFCVDMCLIKLHLLIKLPLRFDILRYFSDLVADGSRSAVRGGYEGPAEDFQAAGGGGRRH